MDGVGFDGVIGLFGGICLVYFCRFFQTPLTTFCGRPFRKACMLAALMSINRSLDCFVAQAMCGVTKKLGALRSGLSACGGSVSMTSVP